MSKTLGQVAFEAYNDAKGGLTYDGKPIPGWDTLTNEAGLTVRAAWEAAALAAVNVTRECWGPETWIQRACMSVSGEPRSREVALALTKLEEALMWWRASQPSEAR